MSDHTDAPATDAPADTTDQPQTDATPKPTETVEFWKQKAREQEKRAKENADAAKRLGEIEDAQKSETEKAAERLAAAEQAANDARREAQRYRIATEYSLVEEHAAALEHVGTEEGMRLIAALLSARSDQQKNKGPRVPREGHITTPGSDDPARSFANELFGRALAD